MQRGPLFRVRRPLEFPRGGDSIGTSTPTSPQPTEIVNAQLACSPIVGPRLVLRSQRRETTITRNFISLFLHTGLLYCVAWFWLVRLLGTSTSTYPSILPPILGINTTI